MKKFYSKKDNTSKPKTGTNNSILSNIKSFFSMLSEKLSFLKWLDPFTYVDLFVMPQVKKITQSQTVEFLVNIIFALFFAWLIYFLLGVIFGSQTPLVIVYSSSMEDAFFRGDVMALGRADARDYFGEEIILDKNISRSAVSNYLTPKYDSEGRLYSLLFEGNEHLYKKSAPVVVYPAYNPASSYDGKPIIHRTILKIIANDGNFVLTKGDNDQIKILGTECLVDVSGRVLSCQDAMHYSNPTFDQDCGMVLEDFERPSKSCITLYPIPVSELEGKAIFRIPLVGCIKLWLVDDLSSLLLTGALPKDFRGIC